MSASESTPRDAPADLSAPQYGVVEWGYESVRTSVEAAPGVEVDAVIDGPDGRRWRVPGFWAGGRSWRWRFAPVVLGEHRFRTECAGAADPALEGRTGRIIVGPPAGGTPLALHGPVRVSDDGRSFAHLDGTPFLWVAENWLMGFQQRLRWPDEFRALLADRVGKGFRLIQLVLGFNSEMAAFDPRDANEAGFPYEPGSTRINPAYFDMVDRRLSDIVGAGLAVALITHWTYHIHTIGVEGMKRYVRYLVARYGAYPVLWCCGGDVPMAWYLSPTRQQDGEWQTRAWSEVAAYLRRIDPYRRPVSAHPRIPTASCDHLDPAVLDFNMLQTGHMDREVLRPTVELIERCRQATPAKPVVVGECCGEGVFGMNGPHTQRLLFWGAMLSGAAGFNYEAGGIWQLNRPERLFGPSASGFSFMDTLWTDAMHFAGSTHVGLGGRILEHFPWHRLEPHPGWVGPRPAEFDWRTPFAAGIPGELRLVYFPLVWWANARTFVLQQLEPGLRYRARYLDPTNGREYPREPVVGDAAGAAASPWAPGYQDWLLVLERA